VCLKHRNIKYNGGLKEMEFKAGELKDKVIGLKEILEKELPVKVAYWLARVADKIDSEMKAFEKARINLATKLAKKDEAGKPILISTYEKIVRMLKEQFKDDEVSFQRELKKLDEQEKANGEREKTSKEYDVNDEDFQKEFNQLLEEKIEIDIKPIKLADLEGETCEKCGKKKGTIKPSILVRLGNIIEE
jgi:hypothetical protein